MIVIKNPTELTMVKAVPFISAGAFFATIVEKRGESAMTTMPQKIIKPIKIWASEFARKNGEAKQQIPENNKA